MHLENLEILQNMKLKYLDNLIIFGYRLKIKIKSNIFVLWIILHYNNTKFSLQNVYKTFNNKEKHFIFLANKSQR